jgi:type VI secretion system protein ImpF
MVDHVRYRVPVLHSFRDSFEKNDSRKLRSLDTSAERVISEHDAVRRRGLTEGQVRDMVMRDLDDLFSTIDLQSAIDLDGFSYASKSVLNFGLYDIAHLASEDPQLPEVEANIIAAVLDYEPRIRRETLQVERVQGVDEVAQRLRLSIYAEISSRPMNVPVDFVAEVDLSSGKATIRQSVGQA